MYYWDSTGRIPERYFYPDQKTSKTEHVLSHRYWRGQMCSSPFRPSSGIPTDCGLPEYLREPQLHYMRPMCEAIPDSRYTGRHQVSLFSDS